MRYIIGFLLSIGLLILVFVMIFRGGGDSTTAPKAPPKLVDYAMTTTVVRLTDDYPVSANQTHHQVVTTVGRDETTIEVRNGYEGDVLRAQSYANNPTSYANFLRSLQIAGYARGNNDEALRDERGYCPTGHRYVYEIRTGSELVQRYWSTSCGEQGSFEGKASTVRTLFRKQVPDYNKLTSGIRTP